MKKRHCVKFCVCQYYDAYNVGLNNICDNARVDFGRHIFGYWQKSTPNSVSSHDDKGPLGPIAVQGDVTAGAATLFVRNPNWHLIGDTDKPQAAETRKKLYDMAASEKMVVQGFHFPFPCVAYVEKSGSGYRLVAVPWSSSI